MDIHIFKPLESLFGIITISRLELLQETHHSNWAQFLRNCFQPDFTYISRAHRLSSHFNTSITHLSGFSIFSFNIFLLMCGLAQKKRSSVVRRISDFAFSAQWTIETAYVEIYFHRYDISRARLSCKLQNSLQDDLWVIFRGVKELPKGGIRSKDHRRNTSRAGRNTRGIRRGMKPAAGFFMKLCSL